MGLLMNFVCNKQFHRTPAMLRIMTVANLWPQLLAGDGSTLL